MCRCPAFAVRDSKARHTTNTFPQIPFLDVKDKVKKGFAVGSCLFLTQKPFITQKAIVFVK